MDKQFSQIKFLIEQGVATITFNRPKRLNAISTIMQDEISETIELAEQNSDVKVIVMTGEGRAFISGADIEHMADKTALDYRKYGLWFYRIRHRIESLSKPVISAVNGYAYGGGALIAFAADLVIASEEAKFGQQEINVGHMAGACYLPRLIGRMRASQIVLLGDSFTASDAQSMGLVNWVVPKDKLSEKTEEIAKMISEKSPTALMMAKHILRIQHDIPQTIAELYEVDLNSLCFGTPEQKESMAAFLEKRKPDFDRL
jgi:enoyl-CoA hydratase